MLQSLAVITSFNTDAFAMLAWSFIYGLIGIVLTIAGYKVFDWITPIDVEKELAERQNVAVAIVCASVILGIAWVISAAIS